MIPQIRENIQPSYQNKSLTPSWISKILNILLYPIKILTYIKDLALYKINVRTHPKIKFISNIISASYKLMNNVRTNNMPIDKCVRCICEKISIDGINDQTLKDSLTVIFSMANTEWSEEDDKTNINPELISEFSNELKQAINDFYIAKEISGGYQGLKKLTRNMTEQAVLREISILSINSNQEIQII